MNETIINDEVDVLNYEGGDDESTFLMINHQNNPKRKLNVKRNYK